MSVDLRHIDTWLFDLDNTLYPAESGFMGEIVVRMTDFVEKVTGLPREEAFKLQKTYLAEHGLTLKGMMLNHASTLPSSMPFSTTCRWRPWPMTRRF